MIGRCASMMLWIATTVVGSSISAAAELPPLTAQLKRMRPNADDVAVVIAVEGYRSLLPVPYAERDAELMAKTLREARGIPAERVRLLVSPDRAAILQAVDEGAREAGRGGTLWLYFAGHGLADPNEGKRMLAAVDATRGQRSFQSAWVTLEELSAAAAPAGHLLAIVDACFSGKSRTGEPLVRARYVVAPDLGREQLSPNATVWWAASEGQIAEPYEAAEHGVFTWLVVGALRGWADGADGSGRDRRVTLAEADAYVSASLLEMGSTQRPLLQVPEGRKSWAMVSSAARLERGPDLASLPDVTQDADPEVRVAQDHVSPQTLLLSRQLGGATSQVALLQRESAGWFRTPEGSVFSLSEMRDLYQFEVPGVFAFHSPNNLEDWTVASRSALCGPLRRMSPLSLASGVGPRALYRTTQRYYVTDSGHTLRYSQVLSLATESGVAAEARRQVKRRRGIWTGMVLTAGVGLLATVADADDDLGDYGSIRDDGLLAVTDEVPVTMLTVGLIGGVAYWSSWRYAQHNVVRETSDALLFRDGVRTCAE